MRKKYLSILQNSWIPVCGPMCCVTACLKCDPLLCANQARQAGKEVSKGPRGGGTLESQTTEIFGCWSDQDHP